MTEAEHCRARAQNDLDQAAATNLDLVRERHLKSAAVWLARAEMFERTGLKSVAEEAA